MDIKIPLITQPLAVAHIKDRLQVNPVSNAPPIAPIDPHQTQSEQQQHLLNATLRQLLPHQTSATLLLTQLLQDLPTLQHNQQLPETLKSLLQTLVQALPQTPLLNNPALLAQSIQNSGVFLEAHLAQALKGTTPSLQQDFKANLLKLKATLMQQLLPEQVHKLSTGELNSLTALQENTNGALSKLLVDQLASLPKEDLRHQAWFVEVPFLTPQGTDSLKLEVERDAAHANEADPSPHWSVTLTLTPPGLGTLYCKVSLVAGELNTYFRSEDPKTLQLIEQRLTQLRAQFEAAGLKPGYIDAQEGQFKKNLANKLPGQTLFDDRA